MALFKKGDKVRQKMPPPIEGTVLSYTVDQETGDVQMHVVWGTNDEHASYFKENELEKVEE